MDTYMDTARMAYATDVARELYTVRPIHMGRFSQKKDIPVATLEYDRRCKDECVAIVARALVAASPCIRMTRFIGFKAYAEILEFIAALTVYLEGQLLR
jgi:hypothetical protein